MIEERFARLEQDLATLAARIELVDRRRPRPLPTVPPERVAALETTLGTYWLSRIGIVSLITGTALCFVTYFGALGTITRVALGYATAGTLAWLGWRLARKHQTFGHVVFGGGLALGYFVTYALHFVPAMRIVDSEPLGIALVALAITGIVATAHRLRSETIAGIALFLGLHTGMLSQVTTLSLVCTTLLAAGAGFFLAANRWVIVPISTVIAVYATHASLALHGGISPGVSVGLACVDFALFAGAAQLRPDLAARSLVGLAALSWLGVLGLGTHALETVSREAVFAFLCALAATHVGLAAVAQVRKAPRTFVGFLLGLAVATAALALPVALDGGILIGGWLALAIAAAVIARQAWPTFGALALVLVLLAETVDRGTAAQAACVVACFGVERLHARGASSLRGLLVAGVALGLLQLAATAVPHEQRALAGVGAALILFVLGFALRSVPYRWAAFGALALVAAHFMGVELAVLSAGQRILTFVVAGVVLLAISFAYTRRRA